MHDARYLDPKYSRWISTDPALGEYIPQAPVSDEAKKHNQNLPGMGGVFNAVNMNLYHYAGNNPIKYTDPDGRDIDVAVKILNKSESLSENTKSIISRRLVENLYKAEDKRLSFFERFGIDGATKGRGQLGEPAYKDVLKNFNKELNEYSKQLNISFSNVFEKDIANPELEDFIVSAYLSLCIETRQKKGRSVIDAAKFGIGCYHGARETITEKQLKHSNTLSFEGTEQGLKNGTKEEQDILKYIEEVLYGK